MCGTEIIIGTLFEGDDEGGSSTMQKSKKKEWRTFNHNRQESHNFERGK